MWTDKPALPDPPPREPGETEEDYNAFLAFLALHPGRRTITETAAILNMPVQDVIRKSVAFNWVERAREYDRAMLEAARSMSALEIANAVATAARAVSAMAQRVLENIDNVEVSGHVAARLIEAASTFFKATASLTGEQASRSAPLAQILQVISMTPGTPQPAIIPAESVEQLVLPGGIVESDEADEPEA